MARLVLVFLFDMNRIHDIYRPKDERKGDWHEVERALTDDELKEQTSRCMNCGQPFCHAYGCPLGNLVPDQNRAVAQGNFKLAYELLSAHSDFPEFTSRICPALCEASCVHGLDEEAVMVRQSEKRIIEAAFANGWVVPCAPEKENGKSAAIVGAGPAGLSAAVTLRRKGWKVTVYERRSNIGGLLRYGIPCFKLGKSLIDRRRKVLEAAGIRFVTDAAPWRMEVPTQSLPVSPPPITSTCFPLALIGAAAISPVKKRFCPSRSSSARWMPPSSRPGIFKSLAAGVPMATTTASFIFASQSAETSRPTATSVTKRIPAASSTLRRRSMRDFSSLKQGMP